MSFHKCSARSLRPSLMAAIMLVVGACGKSPSPPTLAGSPTSAEQPGPVSVPAAPASARSRGGAGLPAIQPTPTADAPTESPDRPRPRVLLWIEGSPDEDTIWRGWPVLVRVQTLSGDPPPDVQLRGPSSVALTRAGKVWFIPATVTAEMAPGSYTLTTGEQQVDIAVGEAPAHLTAVQQSIRARLLVQSAVASGDTAAAQQAADAWVQAAPNSFEAREAQGDLRRARGDSAGALDAYNAAVQRVPRGIDPPPAGLHGKVGALLRERAAALPSWPAAAPSRDEVKYYELIDAGDRALATGDPAAASHSFAEADAWHRERSLTVSSAELDEKRAALGPPSAASVSTPPQAQSTTAGAPLSAAASQPVRPAASATASTSAPAGLAPGEIISASDLTDSTIRADAKGQWAARARASSEYGTPRYGAVQATGEPNIPLGMAGDNTDAWCPAEKNEGTAWIELVFANPVHATEVRVRQNNAPGAIAKIEAITPDGMTHVWWEGVDPFVAPTVREIAWFAVRVPKTRYLVAQVKITLNLTTVSGWKQIDAVQLVAAE